LRVLSATAHILEGGLLNYLALGVNEHGVGAASVSAIGELNQALVIPLGWVQGDALGVIDFRASPGEELFTIGLCLLEHVSREAEGEAAVIELTAGLVDVDETLESGVEDVTVLAHWWMV
jgi:hypothetical protein